MAKLSTYVHVEDDQGQSHVFGPGDDVPDWAAKKITNPDAWDEAPSGHRSPGRESDASEPPRAGKGSSKDDWQQFAASHGVELGDDAGRDDYIAELERRGVIEPKE